MRKKSRLVGFLLVVLLLLLQLLLALCVRSRIAKSLLELWK